MIDFAPFNSEAIAEVAASSGTNEFTIRMVALHQAKPWIPGYIGSVILPIHKGGAKWVKGKMFTADGHDWYYPSTLWWKAHAHTSHPPDGSGCNPGVHAAFLTGTGKNAEFLYGALIRKRGLHILQAEDFLVECAWWGKNF